MPSEEEIAQVIMRHGNCGFGTEIPDKRMLCNDESLHPEMERHENCECAATAHAIAALLPTQSKGAEINAEMLAALRDMEAFVGVMFGQGPDAIIPETVRSPLLNAPIKVGDIMRDTRAAIAKFEAAQADHP